MSSILEPSGRGIELSLSWLRNNTTNEALISAQMSDVFQPLFEADEIGCRPGSSKLNVYIGRALRDNGWRVGTLKWGRLPDAAVQADGKPLGQQRPLRVASEKGVAGTCVYEILCRSQILGFLGRPTRWVPWFGCDEVPRGAIVGGSIGSKPVFIARAVVHDELVAGEFMPCKQRAEFPCDGRVEKLTRKFDVLTMLERNVHPDIFKVFRV